MLTDLAKPAHVVEGLGKAEVAAHGLDDAAVAAAVALMDVHHPARDIAVLLLGEAFDQTGRGEGLEAEFRAEARAHRAVMLKILGRVPDVPEVHVARGVVMPPVAEVERPGAGRGRPPRDARHLVRDGLFQRVVEPIIEREITVAVGLSLVEPADSADQLVVAAPERHAGMFGQPSDLLARLGADAVQPIAILRRVEIAGEHEILPDQQATLGTHLVEPVRLIGAPAPDAQHVHVGQDGAVQKVGHPRRHKYEAFRPRSYRSANLLRLAPETQHFRQLS